MGSDEWDGKTLPECDGKSRDCVFCTPKERERCARRHQAFMEIVDSVLLRKEARRGE